LDSRAAEEAELSVKKAAVSLDGKLKRLSWNVQPAALLGSRLFYFL
jgi:hypothetical protein